ncbi:PREDICTED: uncharacterized protein LOC100637127 isoform X2 [Amphimedon queenslandica]|uniref:Mitochondria-eating protein C-terminal domain-containing protein n=1 Tax=Amphimedon queenslandica TaxID=400682 RepID=A0AAN0J5A1_AMPQE|nr:PREDICTED: uncharacterized protein LOC100637127 isoform X2 [Amphimedon queenslandica]|eukprot:XP_019851927.1 PREDICTED: uncharacterized protein LOC100637127 isoform X2 [Amphimedon queenslandica]
MSDKSYIEKLEEENKYLKRQNKIEIEDDIAALDVQEQFARYFEDVEIKLSGVEKLKLFQIYCNLFQISFDFCRNAFLEKLKALLFALTELTDEEKKRSKTDIKRKKNLADVSKAYQFLVRHSSAELRSIDYSVIEKVKSFFSVRHDKDVIPEIDDAIVEAVKLSWKMQMLPTPMFVCQPEVFNEHWHETHYDSWDDDSTNDLVYYRPVLMNSVGGSIAYKGLVGNDGLGTNILTKETTVRKKNLPKKSNIIIYQGSCNQQDIRLCLTQGFIQKKTIFCARCGNILLKNQACIGKDIKFLHEECFVTIIKKGSVKDF